MKTLLILIPLLAICISTSCGNKPHKKVHRKTREKTTSIQAPKFDHTKITDEGISGYFKGPEYNQDGDVAHQFSNKVAHEVGDYLKAAYKRKVYLKVDFEHTKIFTKGLDQEDSVYYSIDMPFERVDKCEAFTGIEHCGSWDNQRIDKLNERLQELKIGLRKYCSIGPMETKFFKSTEGFQEYWIQFMHRDYQVPCIKQ
jgi:hypothetical protein